MIQSSCRPRDTMFGVLPPGVRVSENFSAYTEPTLLRPAPVPCWPQTLGTLAAQLVRESGDR